MSALEARALRYELAVTGSLLRADLKVLARLHLQCLPGSLFSVVGLGAVGCLYRFMAQSTDELLVIGRDSAGAIRGVSVISLAPHSLMRRLLIGSPMAGWLMLGVRRLPWPALLGGKGPANSEKPELMFLFVDPASRSIGAGRAFVALSESLVRARGCRELTVMTEDSSKNRAIGFYERLGYARITGVFKYGKPFVRFQRNLEVAAQTEHSRTWTGYSDR